VEAFDKLVRHLPENVAAFRSRHPYEFLVRRPVTIFQRDAVAVESDIEYRTVSVGEESDGIPPWEWWIAPLTKRAGNPFPDHLSIGRATNCDVVMRFRYVSKLHARFLMKEGRPISVEDLGSSNGTGMNGHRLPMNYPVEVSPGDRISIGQQVDAGPY
jgi:hypothetical protein